jgi:serine/threonine protein phosphatase PrpC
MRVECYGQTRPQEGRQITQNQDVYTIGRTPVPWAAVFDGAGNAQRVARRAASLLETFLAEVTLGQLLRDECYVSLVKKLDSALLGGAQTTVVGVALVAQQATVFAAGDSRAYLVPFDGPTRLLAETAFKSRLGSGEVRTVVDRLPLQRRDVVVLLSDGAWGPLGLAGIERAVRAAATRHFSEVPGLILDTASQRGRGDDMTAVALRVTQ